MSDYMTRRRPEEGPPSPLPERIRFAILFVGFLAGVIIVNALYGKHPGPAFQLGVGVWLTVWGAVDLVWIARGELERVWLKSRDQSRIAAIARLVVGDALIVLGFVGIL